MTTIRSFLLCLVGALALACGARHDGLDRSRLPEDIRADYDVFARKCSKCHGLARPLQSGITNDEQWVAYVNRMRRQMGSGISYADQEQILRFLRYYAADLRKKEADQHGAAPLPPPPPAPPPATPPAASPSAPPAPEEPKDGG